MEHIPVLKNDVQKYLNLKEGSVVIDATLGLGGHVAEILKIIGNKGELIAFELDEKNLEEAKKRLTDHKNQITYINDNFRYLKSRITGKVDAVLFDLGLSSPHVDDAERGFSFMKDGPLDMRFDMKNQLTADYVVNSYNEEDLIRIFREYGEERMARRIANKICERRKEKKFERTTELAEFIENNLPYQRSKLHPATRVFQAIRIEVNDELNALKEGLKQALEVLKIGGRLVVISYHSLEDRIVKQFLKSMQNPPAKAEEKIYRNFGEPFIKILTKKPVIPSEKEISENPRSRSAKLRACEKITHSYATTHPLARNKLQAKYFKEIFSAN